MARNLFFIAATGFEKPGASTVRVCERLLSGKGLGSNEKEGGLETVMSRKTGWTT